MEHPHTPTPAYTAFEGGRRIASGTLQANALAVQQALNNLTAQPVLIVDNRTGRTVDVDLRGSAEAVAARYAAPDGGGEVEDAVPARGRGRPKLGVVAREVTLLPRHWEWLASQPGGASVVLRKLVEEARRGASAQDGLRQAQERTYHFMQAIAGDLPGFEEATRALFAGQLDKLEQLLQAWPADVRSHALQLTQADQAVA